jgi:hypothetical protein
MEQMQQAKEPTRTVSQSKFTPKKVISFVVAVISLALVTSFVRACNMERNQLPPAGSVVTVWVPHPALGRMIPYQNVEVLKAGTGYIKFRTSDGQIIEQSGQYQIQTQPAN